VAMARRRLCFLFSEKAFWRIGIATLQNQVVQPGEIFSFWELVGPPTEKRGYQAGRAIQGGSLSAEVGGGLCQLAGILHYLALQAGWEIVERFPHSLDLYTEESRYAPLGADAAVAYGYKDLRLRNPHDSPGCFRLEVLPDALVATYCGEFPQQVFPVEFVMEAKENGKKVRTRRMASPEQWEEVGQSFYGNYQGKGLN
ncbi:MAG: VanW family protein, partial [Bacteroidota bacterium]